MNRSPAVDRFFLLSAVLVAGSAAGQIFEDDFDDGLAAARWSPPILTQEDPALSPDAAVAYAFDYATLGIPPAPNSTSGTTVGLSFSTNLTDQKTGNARGETESVGVTPVGVVLPDGDYVFTADLYVYAPGGGGDSEHPSFGVFTEGSTAPIAYGRNPGDGLVWQFDATGGSFNDLWRFEAPGSGETRLGAYEDIPDGSIPGVKTGPKPTVEPYGSSNRWVTLEIMQRNNIVSFSMNGYVIDRFDNTGGAFAGGTVLIGGSDPFDSVNAANRQIFDNVVLDIPEPTAAAWGLLAAASMSRRRPI